MKLLSDREVFGSSTVVWTSDQRRRFRCISEKALVIRNSVLFTKNEPEDGVSSNDLFKGIYAATDWGVISLWHLVE